MKALVNRAKEFLVSEDGPTATEYAVMASSEPSPSRIVVDSFSMMTRLATPRSSVVMSSSFMPRSSGHRSSGWW